LFLRLFIFHFVFSSPAIANATPVGSVLFSIRRASTSYGVFYGKSSANLFKIVLLYRAEVALSLAFCALRELFVVAMTELAGDIVS